MHLGLCPCKALWCIPKVNWVKSIKGAPSFVALYCAPLPSFSGHNGVKNQPTMGAFPLQHPSRSWLHTWYSFVDLISTMFTDSSMSLISKLISKRWCLVFVESILKDKKAWPCLDRAPKATFPNVCVMFIHWNGIEANYVAEFRLLKV